MSRHHSLKTVTLADLHRKKREGSPIVSVTAYDYTTAKLIDQTGLVDFILVGDSLGMVVLGYSNTVQVTMSDMLHHTKAVRRGVERALLVTDMPFMSTQGSTDEALRHMTQMLQEGQANAVKLEGASESALTVIRRATEGGIPVMGHLGFTPQSVFQLSGFKIQAKTEASALQLLEQAQQLQQAGVFAIVLEMVPAEIAHWVSVQLEIPTIGIGAGRHCDGQILVIDDLLGRYPDLKPRFVRTYAELGQLTQSAIQQYALDVIARDFPNDTHEAFHLEASLQTRFQVHSPNTPETKPASEFLKYLPTLTLPAEAP